MGRPKPTRFSTLTPFVNTVKNKVSANILQQEFDAMVILTFNIGSSAFGSSSVLKLVNDPNATTSYASLEAAWKAWKKSQGKVMKGLEKRRQAEWDIYIKGVYKKW
jgi:lysozyme